MGYSDVPLHLTFQTDVGRDHTRPRTLGSFSTSTLIHLIALLVIVNIGLIRPAEFLPNAPLYSLSLFTIPPVMNHEEPAPPPIIAHKIKVPRIETSQLTAPAPELEPPKIKVAPTPTAVEVATANPSSIRLKPQPLTGLFPASASGVPVVNRPPQQVQTGGFGDPNGIRGEGRPGAQSNIARLGAFDLPAVEGVGNGTGGKNGVRGVVVTNQFATPSDTSSGAGVQRGSVKQSGFGDTIAAAPAPKTRSESASAKVPVEILSKPNPAYTPEARQKKIEGEVVVEVMFPAAGPPKVLRVLRGLGYGLDEAAQRAIGKIEFKPAQQDGHAVDSTAVVRVVFKLA